jgi:hypothetical protein
MDLMLPLALATFLVFRRVQQAKSHSTYLNLLSELQADYKTVWSSLSDRAGETLRWPLVVRYLSRRSIAVTDAWLEQQQNEELNWDEVEHRVQVLGLLLTFLRGNVLEGLEVKVSTISQAGNGLFATRRFLNGALLCVYSGTSVSLTQAMQRAKDGQHGDYVMGGFGPFWRVDAGPHPEVLARYINDHFTQPHLANVRFIKLKKLRVALVVATRDLLTGEEIFASYGEGYWRKRT